MGFQQTVQIIQDNPRLNLGGGAGGVEFDHFVEIFGEVQHQAMVDGLAALRGAAAARRHRHAGFGGDGEGGANVGAMARHDHAQRFHLIDRRVGGVTAARKAVEENLAFEGAGQAAGEGAIADLRFAGERRRGQRAKSPRAIVFLYCHGGEYRGPVLKRQARRVRDGGPGRIRRDPLRWKRTNP